jgi:hypothetical protein
VGRKSSGYSFELPFKGAAPRFPSEDKERLLSEILRSCGNQEVTIIILTR